MTEPQTYDEVGALARADERRRCIEAVEEFANAYVSRWVNLQGDRAKAHGWAIMQAAAHLRRMP